MFTATYVPEGNSPLSATYVAGRGYTVRDAKGRVLGHGLTVSQKDGLLKLGHCSVITVAQLKAALLSG